MKTNFINIYSKSVIILVTLLSSTGCSVFREHVFFHSLSSEPPEHTRKASISNDSLSKMIEKGNKILGILEIENDLKSCKEDECKNYDFDDAKINSTALSYANDYHADYISHIESTNSVRYDPYYGKCLKNVLNLDGKFVCKKWQNKTAKVSTLITRALLWSRPEANLKLPNSESASYIVKMMYESIDYDFANKCKNPSPKKYISLAQGEVFHPVGDALYFLWDITMIRVPLFTVGTVVGTASYITSGEKKSATPLLGSQLVVNIPRLKTRSSRRYNYCFGSKYYASILKRSITSK